MLENKRSKMEIGGYDLIFNTEDPKGLAQRIMNFVNWPESIIEQDEGQDFFWYKDAKSKICWDMEGAVLENTMVYFLVREEELTVVVDKEMALSINSFMGVNPNGCGNRFISGLQSDKLSIQGSIPCTPTQTQ